MSVATKFPVTLAERLELGAEIVRFSATLAEYLDLLEEADYNVEFDNNQIIAMSIASDSHEVLVSNMIANLYNVLVNQPGMAVRGSNRHVFIKEFGADYAPDAHIVKGKPQIYTLRKGLTANLNPWLIVEILSPSTRNRDWSEKLPRYKKIPSLRHIFYIEQDRPFASVFNRVGTSMEWLNIDYDHLEQSFTVCGKLIKLAAIYNNVTFPPTE